MMGKQSQASQTKPNCAAPRNAWAVRLGKCPPKEPKAPPFPGPAHTRPRAWKIQQPFLGHKAEDPGIDCQHKSLQDNGKEDEDKTKKVKKTKLTKKTMTTTTKKMKKTKMKTKKMEKTKE